jgi:hypothetical protein
LAYGVDALRELLIGAGHYGLAMDGAVLVGLTAVFLIAGSRFFSRVEV